MGNHESKVMLSTVLSRFDLHMQNDGFFTWDIFTIYNHNP